MRRRGLAVLGGVAVAAIIGATLMLRRRRPASTLIYVGTQASGPGEGIFAAWFDEARGTFAPIGWVAEAERPTWLVADPDRRRLFAVSEVGNAGDRIGSVLSYRYDPGSGALTPVQRVSSEGGGPTHLEFDTARAGLFVANFGGGSVGIVPMDADGTLASVRALQVRTGSGPHRRQQSAHPHGATLDPGGKVLLVPDMGADRVFLYRYDAGARTLDPAGEVATPPGSGPRTILFGRDGRFAYLLSELSAELFVYRWDRGALTEIAKVPLDRPGTEGRSAAAFLLSPDGRFLYASNRATHAIQVYAVDRQTGMLSEVQRIAAGGEKPWCCAWSASGKWLLTCNNGSGEVRAARVSRRTGKLKAFAEGVAVPLPTGLAFGS